MRLQNIKLIGFKSFVDATTISFPSNLTAIVGPNGCGKSNIIDAVRWVMGESSAKQLRGGSLEDVIFNGSTARKAVGRASIELLFDNVNTSLTGQYSAYAEISIRREITRDGQSNYYLNGSRCRRKDIVDIFLGTGLGPRSYAIVEQGMISRLIEAKPEEIRSYIEEAAGISKYKERRRETELRIQHTQENLLRLNDLSDELGKQLNHLQKQADAAERYKKLKQEERLLKGQLQTLKWNLLAKQITELKETISVQESLLEEAISQQQEIEQQITQHRETQAIVVNQTSHLQALFYQSKAEVSHLEQTIETLKERRQEWLEEENSFETKHAAITQQLHAINQKINEYNDSIKSLMPALAQAIEKHKLSFDDYHKEQEKLESWQASWDLHNQQIAQYSQSVQIEQTHIQHLQQLIENHQQRIFRLTDEQRQQELALGNKSDHEYELQVKDFSDQYIESQEKLEKLLQWINTQREQLQRLNRELDEAKQELQLLRGQETSLQALQQVALDQREETLAEWLKQQQLVDFPRLAQLIEVEAGWELAVETVLERHLKAICLENFSDVSGKLAKLPQANLSLVKPVNDEFPTLFSKKEYLPLANKIQASWSLRHLLDGIYIAESLDNALNKSFELSPYESFITQEGVWCGNGWVHVSHKVEAKSGILKRERELTQVRKLIAQAIQQVEFCQQALAVGYQQLQIHEDERDELQKSLAILVAKKAEVQTQQQIHQAHIDQIKQRSGQIAEEMEERSIQVEANRQSLMESQQLFQEAQENLQQHQNERENLLEKKAIVVATVDKARMAADGDKNLAHQCELNLQAAKLQLTALTQDKMNFEQQLAELYLNKTKVGQLLAESTLPLAGASEKLQHEVIKKEQLAEDMNVAQENIKKLEHEFQKLSLERQEVDLMVQTQRHKAEEGRLAGQAAEVRAKSLEETLQENGYELTSLLSQLPDDISELQTEERLVQIQRKVERLGPINLAAIDEFNSLTERKQYLDRQNQDLVEALATLQDAINKMDQETRARFEETYEKINANFQNLFPTLFGGGHASLQLNDDDLLVSGVTLTAQPPGKRNSSIHLLSGGEKALVAIALVFAFFQLNPAPFCMLDEVDAPLDDANVGRFCNLVKHMAKDVQFIFISHNKLAIEMAEQLAGVTMQEAGVSRLVAVDVEEAIALASV